MNEKKYTIVLAGNYNQFEYFLDEIGGTDSDYIYGDIHNIRGIIARDVVEYGTFWDRKDSKKIKELAESRIK